MERANYSSQHTELTLTGVRYVDSLYKVPEEMQQAQFLSRTGSQSYDQSEVISRQSEEDFHAEQFNHSCISSDEELKKASKKISENSSGENDILKTTLKSAIAKSTYSVYANVDRSKIRKNLRHGKYEDPEVQLKNMPHPATIQEQALENYAMQSRDDSERVCLRGSQGKQAILIQNLKRENFLLKSHINMIQDPLDERKSKSKEVPLSSQGKIDEDHGQNNKGIYIEQLQLSQIADPSERGPQTAYNPPDNRLLQITDESMNSGTTKPKQRNPKKDRLIAEQKQLLENEDVYEIPEVEIDQFPNNRKKNELQMIGSRLFRKFHKNNISQDEIVIQVANSGQNFTIRFHYDEENTIEWDLQGNFYIGNCRSQYKEGLGFEIIEGEEKYMGNFQNGLRHGIGRVRNMNGEYIGNWMNGVKEGYGEQIDIEGNIYKGEWKEDKYHGEGQIITSKGEYFKGKFENGMKNGYGQWHESMNGGDRYKGNYVKDKKHGYGEYFYSDSGNVFQGHFRNGIKINSAKSKKSVEKKPSLGKVQLLQRKKSNSLNKSARKYSIHHSNDQVNGVILPEIYQSHQTRNQLALKKPMRTAFIRHTNLSIYGGMPSNN